MRPTAIREKFISSSGAKLFPGNTTPCETGSSAQGVSLCLCCGLAQAYQSRPKSARLLSQFLGQDELTRLANRRTFNEWLEREWSRSLRSQGSLALIMCDVDYFKRYNDTYGHPRGDDCLRQVADAIQQAAKRPTDLAARYGGEEFVVLLPNTDAQGALQVARAIQLQVQALQLDHVGSRVSPFVTLSMGVASLVPSADSSPERLVNAADAGLYEAKHKGRNQVVFQVAQLPVKKDS
jgi:adenylate cyclase